MAATKGKTTKNASSGSKQTTRKSTSKQVRKAEPQPVQEKLELTEKEIKLRNEVKLIISLAITILLMLSNFGILSPAGDYVSYFMFGMVGISAYILPVVVFLAIAFVISNNSNGKAIGKFVSGCFLYAFISSLLQLILVKYSDLTKVTEYYTNCGKDRTGGGIIGGAILKGLVNIIGIAGAVVVLIVLSIICLIIITEKSFIGGVKHSSKKVYDTAAESVEKVRENKIKRDEERKYYDQQRMNKKVRGVNITKVSDEDEDNEDENLHEITNKYEEQFGDADIYRGHVEIDDEMPQQNEEQDTNDYNDDYFNQAVKKQEIPEYRYEEYTVNGVKEVIDTDVDRNNSGFDMNNSEGSSGIDEPQYDEDGLFRPKEKIEVSQNAIDAMKRKPFAGITPTGSASTNNSSNCDNNSNKNDNINAVHNNEKPRSVEREFKLPPVSLLTKGASRRGMGNDMELRATANKLQKVLENFGVRASVTEFSQGPSVTRYELQPETGTKVKKITELADDIKLNLAASDIRIEAPIPGKAAVGIEVPNSKRESVLLRELIESDELAKHSSKIAFAAGKDISGKVVVADIAKMPHMLIAGTTGSGKSVFTNSIIMSILFRAKPSEVKLIIVDPKVVEFGVYNGIPHLLQPVVTDPKLAANSLKWAVNQMSERYKKFADMNVRDLKGYNEKAANYRPTGPDDEIPQLMPQIVIIIDELADLMMAAAKEVEESICRLAQLARAAGIHLIIATQRPSVDVVTGLIKANIPSRVALLVASGTDSRTIIDSNGAEKLLGNGDMLFYPSGYVKPIRVQGAFVSDAEVQKVVEYLKNQAKGNQYDDSIMEFTASSSATSANNDEDERDEYFLDAARFVVEKEKASASMLQRVFKIGFNRAARIMEQLTEAGVISEEEGTKPRRILMTAYDIDKLQ